MRNHEDLEVWRRAHSLTLLLYSMTERFPKSEMFGLTSQIRRASSSMGANLAEGCGRWSDAEFARFVRIAMGSASELQYHLLLAKDLKILTLAEHSDAFGQLTRVRQMLTALLKTLTGTRRTPTGALP